MRFLSQVRSRVICAILCAGLARLSAAPVDHNPPVGWWRDASFYEIFVRSFADARTGPRANDGVGDLQGLIDHLDYLNDGRGGSSTSLGITALWLMPIQPSPSYHGYDVTDYFAVNPQYGDVALMKRFVDEAHRRGIRVVIDFVLNHCSSEHPLFTAAARATGAAATDARGWFRFSPVPKDIAGPWDQRVWHPSGDDFYYGVFGADMPDWNFRDARVTAHHRKAAEFWLREVGVDGFRLDAVRYFYEQPGALQDTEETERWLTEFTAFCHSVKPGAFVVGENTAASEEIARYMRRDSVDSGFEFNIARATVESIRLRAPGLLSNAVGHSAALNGGASDWSTFLSNHDQERIADQLNNDPELIRFAAKLLFTLPGVPFVYYGEELGMTGKKPDPEIRTPMPWSAEPNAGFAAPAVKPWHAITGDVQRINVAVEQADPGSLLALYRKAIQMRAHSAALRHGKFTKVSCTDRKVYVAFQQTERDAVLVMANFDRTPHAGPEFSLPPSTVRPGWRMHEEFVGAAIATPTIAADGAIANWTPIAELPPLGIWAIHWAAP